jgi:hypothetical protein
MLDEVIAVTDEEAFAGARRLAREKGNDSVGLHAEPEMGPVIASAV